MSKIPHESKLVRDDWHQRRGELRGSDPSAGDSVRSESVDDWLDEIEDAGLPPLHPSELDPLPDQDAPLVATWWGKLVLPASVRGVSACDRQSQAGGAEDGHQRLERRIPLRRKRPVQALARHAGALGHFLHALGLRNMAESAEQGFPAARFIRFLQGRGEVLVGERGIIPQQIHHCFVVGSGGVGHDAFLCCQSRQSRQWRTAVSMSACWWRLSPPARMSTSRRPAWA